MATRWTTTEKAYPYYGIRSYRIEVDLSAPYRPMQRHIWTYEDGTVRVDDWIDSLGSDPKTLPSEGFTPIAA